MKITKEQIVKLDKGEISARELFPEVFKTKLEVGKWYKMQDNDVFVLFFITKIENEIIYGYGFVNGEYTLYSKYYYKEACENLIPATKKEAKTALIREAKKIGFNNIDTLSIKLPNLKIYPKGFFSRGFNNFKFDFKQNILKLSGVPIFDNGTWAEIIKPKQMTKEEIEKELGYEIEIKS